MIKKEKLHLLTTATSPQWPPLHSGHLSTAATSLQWPPLYSGHHSTAATALQRPPLYSCHRPTVAIARQGHCSTAVTALQRSPLYKGHFFVQRDRVWTFTIIFNLSTTATSRWRILINDCRMVYIQNPIFYCKRLRTWSEPRVVSLCFCSVSILLIRFDCVTYLHATLSIFYFFKDKMLHPGHPIKTGPGVLPEKLGWGMRPASQNSYPI